MGEYVLNVSNMETVIFTMHQATSFTEALPAICYFLVKTFFMSSNLLEIYFLHTVPSIMDRSFLNVMIFIENHKEILFQIRAKRWLIITFKTRNQAKKTSLQHYHHHTSPFQICIC